MPTVTATETYTSTDIAKVFEVLTAELRLIARSTGLWTQDYALQVSEDVVAFARNEYLREVHVVLSGARGDVMRVHEYKVSTDASGWSMQGPRGNVWPETPGGSLRAILFYGPGWDALDETARARFRSQRHLQWSPTTIDTNYPGLTTTETRTYASHAYGLRRGTKERG